MQNNNPKVTNILLVIIIILLGVGIWMLTGKSEREPRIESVEEVTDVVEEEQQVEEKPVVIQQKPTATTLAGRVDNYGGCYTPEPAPCSDLPASATFNGTFDGKGLSATTWFEYWSTEEVKVTTSPVVSGTSGAVTKTTYSSIGSPMYYRLVVQTQAGTTYGNTVNVPIAMP